MSTTDSPLVHLLATAAIRCVYQPVVDLDDREVVAHEALMRGPVGDPLESAVALLQSARSDTELAALDRLAHTVALQETASRRGVQEHTLFLNIEPRGIGRRLPGPGAESWAAGRDAALAAGLQVVVELTERALLDDPGLMLWSVGEMRDLGARIALDDVGAVPESLAFLPIVRPDVVKLDLRLVREHDSLETARIANAVRAYAERSGAEVVAEGVETERDHEVALSLGATLGQGWLYGRPGPLPETLGARRRIGRVPLPSPTVGQTPYEVVAAHRPSRLGDKGLLLPISQILEEEASALAIPPMLLGCFQDAEYFTAATQHRYVRLARRLPLVGALGTSMAARPAAGVRGAGLAAQDALAGEWNVVVLGAHYAAALVAQDRGDDPSLGRARRFDYVVTHDRDLVTAAAQTLLSRVLRHDEAGQQYLATG